MEKESKRFEGWEEVDCNDCSHYWDSSCDGASKGSKINCNSFLATRSVVIPERLNQLDKRVAKLELGDTLQTISLVLCAIYIILDVLEGWF